MKRHGKNNFNDITDLAARWYPELKDIIFRHNLIIKLDHMGFGKCIFYKGEEVGYFFEYSKGIELHYADKYGTDKEFYTDWEDVVKSIEDKLSGLEI